MESTPFSTVIATPFAGIISDLGIICGPICGSFPVLRSFAARDHLRARTYPFKSNNYRNLGFKISQSILFKEHSFSLFVAFQTVPSLDVTSKKLITNFLGFTQIAGITKRQSAAAIVDTVIVLDGSGSVPRCDFSKAKEALKHMMSTLHNPGYDSKFAAVTFSSTATVSFQFLPYSSAANRITTISYPGSSTNTQAALLAAKNLFDDPNSGTLPIIISAVKQMNAMCSP